MSFIPVVFPKARGKKKKKSVRQLEREKREEEAARQAKHRPTGSYVEVPSDFKPVLDDKALAAIVGPRERDARPDPWAPARPETIEETGLTQEFLSELVLKHLYVRGAKTGRELAEAICLLFPLIDPSVQDLRKRRLVEVVSSAGNNQASYVYNLTNEGRIRTRELLEGSRYVGPAPIQLDEFTEAALNQRIQGLDRRLSRQQVKAGFSDLVLSEEAMATLGPAMASARSIFLHGYPGNGKTSIAERVSRLMTVPIYIPYAVLIEGEVMLLYDPRYHEKVVDQEPGPDIPDSVGSILSAPPLHDQRYVCVERPSVFVGGELTMDELDLQYDPYTKVYTAPFQLKAVGGALIIDDFGRQRMSPDELLNRWIVPLEKQVDYLSSHSGVRFEVPFECLLIFATNLDPSDLVDEAFLRRINYKIEVKDPDRGSYEEIFRMMCDTLDMSYDPEAVEYVFEQFYGGRDIRPRGCHPRDILNHLKAAAVYEGVAPELTPEALDQACRSYFLIMEAGKMADGTIGDAP
ncbi:MAG: hypothetical protein ACR2QM_03955 [Longimicrobiales bacterium]